jgi:hypothetical protein
MEMMSGGFNMSVIFTALPNSLHEFIQLPQQDLKDPEHTCALFLCALKLFVANREEGVAALNILKGPSPLSTYDIHWYADRLMDKNYLPLAYFEGATPQNNYTPSLPYTLHFFPDPRPQDCEAGYMRLYLKTAGADSPRAIRLRKKGDNWYLWDAPAIMTGVRIPAKEDPWA